MFSNLQINLKEKWKKGNNNSLKKIVEKIKIIIKNIIFKFKIYSGS